MAWSGVLTNMPLNNPSDLSVTKDNRPFISVLVCVRNEELFLSDTLTKLRQQSLNAENFEVLIIDGLSSDRTFSIASSFAKLNPSFKVLANPKILSAAGWNLGIRNANGEVILILSGHAFISSDYLKFIFDFFSRNRVSGFGVSATPVGRDPVSSVIASAFTTKLGNGGASFMNLGAERSVESISFGAYWKRDLLEIGGFDENIARGQDWDLNLRLRKANKILWFDPSMRIEYSTRSNFKSLWRRQYLAGLWKYFIHKKNKSKFLLRHLIPAMFAAYIPLVFGLSFIDPTFAILLIGTFITHLCLSYFEFSKKSLPVKQFPFFWWALLIIQIAYGAGFIVGLIRPPRNQ